MMRLIILCLVSVLRLGACCSKAFIVKRRYQKGYYMCGSHKKTSTDSKAQIQQSLAIRKLVSKENVELLVHAPSLEVGEEAHWSESNVYEDQKNRSDGTKKTKKVPAQVTSEIHYVNTIHQSSFLKKNVPPFGGQYDLLLKRGMMMTAVAIILLLIFVNLVESTFLMVTMVLFFSFGFTMILMALILNESMVAKTIKIYW